ncbi:unnamed protein product [Psylliodes chrysocephalus]|uniref:Uncharacterized protein n=1 Tax=Psylliodes chrysocephalus TaxID=3402493 RepID=A0A9P0D5F6_9CUCU|nr:unnamed protein product [Psylliodes chrysocephala]
MDKVDNIILDVDISQLEIGETQTEILKSKEEKDVKSAAESEIVRRSSRKKILPIQTEKKRVISKPKRLSSNGTIDANVINYYLDKKIKRFSSSLETIFEQPKSDEPNSNQDLYMSRRKFVRTLPAKDIKLPKNKKIKKRNMKVKKINKRKNLPMEMLLKKLASIAGV